MANRSLAGTARDLVLLPVLLVLSRGASAAPPEIPLSAFRAELSAAQQLVSACRVSAGACDSQKVPSDAPVHGEGATPGFFAGWGWLHEALGIAAKAPPAERAAAMEAAAGHLAEWGAQTAGSHGTPGFQQVQESTEALPAAHAAAARILARDEFLADAGPGWLDRQIARVQDWFLQIFRGMGRVGARNPWIAPVVEWLCFGLAAAGLLLFVRRSLSRQALRISLAGSAVATANPGRSGGDWLRAADAAEAAGKGREAMHCLYWAAIASLEARKAWRPNPTRTPREYISLLQPGSGARGDLRNLTRRFEQTWYGSADPTPAEIHSARQELTALQTGSLERASQDASQDVSPGSFPLAASQKPAVVTGNAR